MKICRILFPSLLKLLRFLKGDLGLGPNGLTNVEDFKNIIAIIKFKCHYAYCIFKDFSVIVRMKNIKGL